MASLLATLFFGCAASVLATSVSAPHAKMLRREVGADSGDERLKAEDTFERFRETYQLSSVSETWANQVVYAIFTSGAPGYHDNLVAQLDTWAKRAHSEGRFVAVAGRDYPKDWQEPGKILAADCDDTANSLPCKEAKLIAEGAARGASWIFIIGEDNYVDADKLEAWLQTRSASTAPEAWGTPGCGAKLGEFCKDIDEHGGFCGGSGYALNKATLQSLLSNGVEALNKEYNKTWQNDMVTSCALRDRGVELRNKEGLNGNPLFGKSEYDTFIKDGFMTLHYVTPPTMRWIHAAKNNDTAAAASLAASTFEGPGCEKGKNKGNWAKKEYKECVNSEADKEAALVEEEKKKQKEAALVDADIIYPLAS